MPSPAEPERDGAGADTSEGARKPEEQHQEPQPACSPEERRHSQRERLNHILLSLLDKIPGKNGERGAAAVGSERTGGEGEGRAGEEQLAATRPAWKGSSEDTVQSSWQCGRGVTGSPADLGPRKEVTTRLPPL